MTKKMIKKSILDNFSDDALKNRITKNLRLTPNSTYAQGKVRQTLHL